MSNRPMFALGQLVATPGALAKFEEAGQHPRTSWHATPRAIGAT